MKSAASAGSIGDEVLYAAEWANKAEDSLISAAAGGDEIDDYSALHFANKAAISLAAIDDQVLWAAEWANKAEDVLISVAAGGDGVDDYSAFHHSQKAEDFAASVNPALLFTLADNENVTGNPTFSHASGINVGSEPITEALIAVWNAPSTDNQKLAARIIGGM